jgi:glucose uptake protein GlcU
MITATVMDTVTVTTAMPIVTEISATGTALTTIICLRVWRNASIFLPD